MTRTLRLTITAAAASVVLLAAALVVYMMAQQQINVASAVQEACAHMDLPYDTVITATTPTEKWRWELMRSGQDFHRVLTARSVADDTLLFKQEYIVKDRNFYTRQSPRSDPDNYSPWRLSDTNVPYQYPLPCVQGGNYQSGGGQSGSDDPADFVRVMFLSQEEGSVRDEFWVDENNRPTHSRRTFLRPDLGGGDGADSSGEEFTLLYTYSDFGSPNTITAPMVPGSGG